MSATNISIVSHPRSGSTYLASLLANFVGMRTVMEPFHQQENVAAAHIKTLTKDRYSEFSAELEDLQSSIYEFGHTRPVDFLDTLSHYVRCDHLVFKVFPGHLAPEKLEELLKGMDLIIFLTRNTLHSYISYRIASSLHVWRRKDTSNIKVDIDEASFIRWNNKNYHFLKNAHDIVKKNKLPYIDVQYENLLNTKESLEELSQRLEEKGILLEIKKDICIYTRKQDLRQSAYSKVNDVSALNSLVTKFGIKDLIDATEPVPRYHKI